MADDERKTSTSTSAEIIVGYGLSDGKVAAVGGPPFLARPPLHLCLSWAEIAFFYPHDVGLRLVSGHLFLSCTTVATVNPIVVVRGPILSLRTRQRC